MEKEVDDIRSEKTQLDTRLASVEEKYSENEEKERDHIQKLTKDFSNLKFKYENLLEKERVWEEELSFLKEEKARVELSLNSYKENETSSIELDKYNELEVKLNETKAENEKSKEELIKYKVDCESFAKQIETLQHELSLRDKSLALLQNYVAKSAAATNGNANLPTINEDEDGKESAKSAKIDDIMNVANLQMKVHDLEQQLQTDAQEKASWESEKSKYELELKSTRKEYDDIKRQYDESIVRVKRLETENKLFEELRVKDIERNVRKEFLLEAELKKKSSDAERAAHLLGAIETQARTYSRVRGSNRPHGAKHNIGQAHV